MNSRKFKNIDISVIYPFLDDDGSYPGILWTLREKTKDFGYNQESPCFYFRAIMEYNGTDIPVEVLAEQNEGDKIIVIDCLFNGKHDSYLQSNLDKELAIHFAEYHSSFFNDIGLKMSDVFYMNNFNGCGLDAVFAEFSRDDFAIDFGFFINKDLKGDVEHLLKHGIEGNTDEIEYMIYYNNDKAEGITDKNIKFGLGLYMMREIEKELEEDEKQRSRK